MRFKNIFRCKICGIFKSNWNLDVIIVKINKNKFNKICVVENIADQWSIESSKYIKVIFIYLEEQFLLVTILKKRRFINEFFNWKSEKDNIDEVILATSATVEGQTTAFYIQDSLKNTKS